MLISSKISVFFKQPIFRIHTFTKTPVDTDNEPKYSLDYLMEDIEKNGNSDVWGQDIGPVGKEILGTDHMFLIVMTLFI